ANPGVIAVAATAADAAEAFEVVPRRVRCFAGDGLIESGVEGEFVDVPPRRRLVDHRMCGVQRGGCGDGFGGHVSPRADRVKADRALMSASISDGAGALGLRTSTRFSAMPPTMNRA